MEVSDIYMEWKLELALNEMNDYGMEIGSSRSMMKLCEMEWS